MIAFRLRADDHEGLVDAPRRHRGDATASRASGSRATRSALGAGWDDVPLYETFPNSRAAGRAAARALLALEPRPTALLAMSDELALGALEVAARARASTCRGELSVVGYDDVAGRRRGRADHRPPAAGGEGPRRGRMLLEALDGGTPADVTLPTELVVRGSTRAVRP